MSFSDLSLHLLIGPLMLLISIVYILFLPKKINLLYGHRTRMSMLNLDTWKEANKRSSKAMLLISVITCAIQLFASLLSFEVEKTILFSTIFLVVGLVISMLIVEKKLKEIFDNQGNRK